MASIHSKIFGVLLRFLNMKGSWEKEMRSGNFHLNRYQPQPPRWLLRKVNLHTEVLHGHHVYTLIPREGATQKVILYLHGGGYVHPAAMQHWKLVCKLIEKTGCTVVFPDYPLAPAFTCKDSFAMVEPLCRRLLLEHGTENVVLMGDSAGGGFALALAQKLKTDHIEGPSQIVLLSPWLDVATANPEMEAIDPKDAFLGIKGIQLAGAVYAGDLGVHHYWVSPLNGPLDGLGKISVFVGTHEIFVADTRKLKKRCEAEGIAINYYEYEEMPHVFMLFPFPEARHAVEAIAGLVRN